MIYDLRLTTHRGSALVNILVACGIIAVMATIAIPAVRQYQPNVKLKAEGRRLISDLRYAQQLTITEQKVYYVEMDMVSARYQIIKQEEPETPLKTVNLDEEVNFQQIIDLDNNRVVFNSYGAVSQAGQIVLVNSQDKTITINVKPSGYVQLQP